MKDKYKMMQEILEQKEVFNKIIKNRHSIEMQRVVLLLRENIESFDQIFLVGSGSSYNSAIFASYFFAKKNKLIVNCYFASEFKNFTADLTSRSLVIIISKSGETADILSLLDNIKKSGAKLLALCNEKNSKLAKKSDAFVPILAGKSYAIPAIKSYLAEVITLVLISEELAGANQLIEHKNNISQDITRITNQTSLGKIKQIAVDLAVFKNIFVLAEGICYANALETALKIKECAQIEAEGCSALEFRHGPISLINKDMAVIVFITNTESKNAVIKISEEIKKRGAKIIAISTEKNKIFDQCIEIADNGIYSAISAIIPAQLLAYELALAKNLNPDYPKGLEEIVK